MSQSRLLLSLRALVFVALLIAVFPQRLATAQASDGATMTILRGQVAISRPNGSAVQPAPSGSTVFPGDQISTLSESGAVITFFSGTEVELGEDTILVVERVSKQGDRVEVSLKQVFGSTLNRVVSFTSPGSSYRLEAGGMTLLVRGTEYYVLWMPPVLVVVVTEGTVICDSIPLSPGGYWTVAEPVPACSTLESFKADLRDPWNSLLEGKGIGDREGDSEEEKEGEPGEDDEDGDDCAGCED